MTSQHSRPHRILALAILLGSFAVVVSAAPAPPVYKLPGNQPARPKVTYVDDTVVVARVGDKVIRASDFVDRWFSDIEYRPVPDSVGLAEFLKRLVDKEVIANVARSAKFEETFEDRATMRNSTRAALGNALFAHAVLESVQVSPAEAESVYNQMKRQLHLARIRFGSFETAERMRRDIVAGRLSWTSAWNLRLRIPGDASVTSDIGWQSRQSVPPDFARAIFSQPIGGIAGPLLEPPGYSLYQVKEERPLKLQDFRMYRSVIMDQIRQEKTAYYRERVAAGIRKSVGLRVDSTGAAFAASRFPKKLSGEGTSRVVMDITVPTFAPEDTGRVLATYKDGKVTLGRLLENYRAIPDLMRPSLDTPEAVRQQIDVIVLEPMFADIARKRGYDRDSTVKVLVERQREELLVEHLFRDSIQAKVFVPPATRRKYFEDNKHRFVTPPNARYAAFYVERKSEADSLVDQLRTGTPATAVVRADSIAGYPRGQVVDRRQDDMNMSFPQVFGDMKVGEIRLIGPNKDGAYNVLQLIDRDWGRPVTFEQADPQIDEFLQQEACDRELEKFVARHAKGMTIEIHPEVLRRIRLIESSSPWETTSAQR
jgi:hypothetical protein